MRLKNTTELLTEKGKVKANIREQLVKTVGLRRELFAKAEKVENGVFEIPVHNAEGNQVVYIRFEVKVSEKSATDLAPKTKKSKTQSQEIEVE